VAWLPSEAAQELGGGQRQFLVLGVSGVVAVAELNRTAVAGEAQAAIADRHALRARQSADRHWLRYLRTCARRSRSSRKIGLRSLPAP